MLLYSGGSASAGTPKSHQCYLLESALAERWGQETEPIIEPRHPNVGYGKKCVFFHRVDVPQFPFFNQKTLVNF